MKSNTTADVTTNSIIFEDGTKYKYEDGSIYIVMTKKLQLILKVLCSHKKLIKLTGQLKNIITVNLDVGEDEKSYVKTN